MKVIPVINCADIECVKKKIEVAKTFLAEGDLMHLDITDGSFAKNKTWNDPLGWVSLKSPFALEVHLMMHHPEEHADNWFAAGVRRLIVHVESLTPESLHVIFSDAERYEAEVVLSSLPETGEEDLLPYLKQFTAFQVLAVHAGVAGQTFMPFAEEKIRLLREEAPNATIEVDGGMDPATVRLVKGIGADSVVSSSYIFNAADPKKAYEELSAI